MAAFLVTPLIAARIDHDQTLVAQGALHPDCATTFYPAHAHTTPRGVVLLLHGFTAGPWQYRAIGQQLQGLGLHGYAARLPGHGATAQSDTGQPAFRSDELPKSTEVRKFAQCADEAHAAAYQLAQTLGLPLMVVGFSAGGALAVDLILRAPQTIARAVLIAPLLRPRGRTRRVFFRAMHTLPFGGRIIDRVPFAWRTASPRSDGWVRPGHSRFHLGNVSALFAYSRALKAASKGWQVPTQFILTATDDKIDAHAARYLARRGPVRHPVWWFDEGAAVPHAMLSPEENPDPQSRRQVHHIVGTYLADGVGHSNI
jgi:pimeloyl-ACP methyl ester carboxylesterase